MYYAEKTILPPNNKFIDFFRRAKNKLKNIMKWVSYTYKKSIIFLIQK
jgi:hypothetical protein